MYATNLPVKLRFDKKIHWVLKKVFAFSENLRTFVEDLLNFGKKIPFSTQRYF